jgi:hypothetical protein
VVLTSGVRVWTVEEAILDSSPSPLDCLVSAS